MAYKKIDKEICLTDNSVNVYGYRLLTEGLQLDRFKPAIGFLMHDRNKGVAVRWEDFRTEGDKVYAKPVVNETQFPNLAQQISDGFYDAASCGNIVALELSDDPKMKLEGQIGPTVTKWFPRDISIVDIPGNYNALSKLFDESDNILRDLSDKKNNSNQFQKPNEKKMEDLKLTPGQVTLLDLKADSTPEQLDTKLQDLVAKAKRVDDAEKALNDLKAEATKKEVDAVLAQGVKDRKITNDLSAKLAKDYATNPQGLKDLVDGMQPQTMVTSQTGKSGVPTDLPEKFKGKSFSDLYVSGDLAELKADFPDYYNKLKGGDK